MGTYWWKDHTDIYYLTKGGLEVNFEAPTWITFTEFMAMLSLNLINIETKILGCGPRTITAEPKDYGNRLNYAQIDYNLLT